MEWRQTVLRASILQMWTEKKAQFGLSHVKEQKNRKNNNHKKGLGNMCRDFVDFRNKCAKRTQHKLLTTELKTIVFFEELARCTGTFVDGNLCRTNCFNASGTHVFSLNNKMN
jgi:hypothetical protein